MKALLIVSKTIVAMAEATEVKDVVKLQIQNEKTGEILNVILANRGIIVEPGDDKNAVHIYAGLKLTDDDIIEVLSDYFNAEHVNHFTEGASLN